jgi:hypothetical protein
MIFFLGVGDDGEWLGLVLIKSAARPIDRFAARRGFAVAAVPLFIVLDRRRIVLIVVMRIFILLVQTLIRHLRGLRRIAHELVPPDSVRAAAVRGW